jgi:sugar phosphate permease
VAPVRQQISVAMSVLSGRRPIFRGWWILVAAIVSMMVGSGVSFWSLGLYISPLEEEFGWSRAQVSLGFSVGFAVAGLSGPAIGRIIDMQGARRSIVFGSIGTAMSYLLIATTDNLWQWFTYMSVNAFCRQFMFFIPFQALISRWFDRRRGVALGFFGSGFSLGGLLLLPVMGLVIDSVGWRGGFVFSAVAVAVVFVPVGLFVVRNAPADVGEVADGDRRSPGVGAEPVAAELEGVPLSAALRMPLFWLLGSALALFLFGIFGLMVHQVPLFESLGVSRRTAAAIVAIASGAGIPSRLAFSFAADRMQRFEGAAICMALLLCAAMLVLLIDSSAIGIGLFLFLVLVGRSGGPLLEAMILTRTFGVRYFATLLGALVVMETVGQILSPWIAGAIFDATGSYDLALLLYLGTYGSSVVLFLFARRATRPDLSQFRAESRS